MIKTATFKEWTLTKLEKAFGIKQIYDSEYEVLKKWQDLSKTIKVSDFDKQLLLNLQTPLKWGGKGWNEYELENKFISPVIMAVQFDDLTIGYFLERHLKGVVGDYELSGIVDGMIATGVRDPDKPFFCMHEYKRSVDNDGQPDAQALAAMLVVQADENDRKPIYGLYIVGLIWNFMVLNGNEYCISRDYKSDNEEIFDLFRMLKALKHIIKTELM
ncbi:MAG: hypothetical protein EAZ97_14890 [Bacteroidetes bacterium]|nr:MAG: hypothetical protein EAZ97_14890 [Bacteroidota bacterium]